MDDRANQWDSTYTDRGATGVSWFQAVPAPSLHMIDVLGIAPAASVIDVGGGAASLVDHLIALGFIHLTVLDISEVALTVARARVGGQGSVWCTRTSSPGDHSSGSICGMTAPSSISWSTRPISSDISRPCGRP
jgi:hypothetical protein